MYFWTAVWKQHCQIWYQHPRNCLNVKYRQKTKMHEFGTKIAIFECFWLKIPYLGFFGKKVKKKLLSYSKSASLNLSICIFHEKTKILKFGTKHALFGYFSARLLKNFCHIWNQHPRIYLIAKILWRNKNA